MKKRKKHSNKIIPQYLVQSFSVVIACVLGSYFMTWFVNDFLGIKRVYLGASLELIGPMLTKIALTKAGDITEKTTEGFNRNEFLAKQNAK